jgi:DNA polymerase III sliding clamp (beta) subunit (PCNA family)
VKLVNAIEKPTAVGFNGAFIGDILDSLQGEHVSFDFFDVGGPNIFRGDRADGTACHVIMPMRVWEE